MAHFAKIEFGTVVKIVVADKMPTQGHWVETHPGDRCGIMYDDNGNEVGPALRKNFAGIGYIYDGLRDAFIQPSPGPDWIFNEEACTYMLPPEEEQE